MFNRLRASGLKVVPTDGFSQGFRAGSFRPQARKRLIFWIASTKNGLF